MKQPSVIDRLREVSEQLAKSPSPGQAPRCPVMEEYHKLVEKIDELNRKIDKLREKNGS